MSGRHCYLGRFPVPEWLFAIAPGWLHHAADFAGGVVPSPWPELRRRVKVQLWCRFFHAWRFPHELKVVISTLPDGSGGSLRLTVGPGRDFCEACASEPDAVKTRAYRKWLAEMEKERAPGIASVIRLADGTTGTPSGPLTRGRNR